MQLTCPRCGFKFQSSFGFANSIDVIIKDNSDECPRCHYPVKLPEGVFDFDSQGEIITALSGPAFTTEVLLKIKVIAEQAQTNQYSAQKVTEEFEAITPAASVLAKFLPKDFADLVKALGIIIVIINHLLGIENKQPQTINTTNTYNTTIIKNNTEITEKRGGYIKRNLGNTNKTPPKKKRIKQRKNR